MSYYLRINDTVHTNTQNPFKAAYQVQTSSWGEYDYNTTSTTFMVYNRFEDKYGTPLIALKDGSKPVFDYFKIFDNIDYGTPVGHTDPYSYVCMCMASFSSSNEQYCLANTATQVTAFYRSQSNTLASIKEIYNKNEPLIRYVNLDKGNMLSWSIDNPDSNNKNPNPNIDFMSDYVHYIGGPTYPSVSFNLLRNHPSWGNTSDSATYNDFPANIGNYKNVRFKPQSTNTKFGYTEHLLNMSDLSGRGTLSYYTLNVSDIKTKGNKLKLNYYYTILFDGDYSYNSSLESYEMVSPPNLSADWNKYFSDNSTYRYPFIFNYHLNDTTSWNFNETNKLLQIGVNLTSAWRYRYT